MGKHPYPEHVVEAVNIALEREFEGPLFSDHYAHAALQALWDASRVETPEQLEALQDQAIVHDGYFSYEKDVYAWLGGWRHDYIPNDEMDLPMRIIYWGESNG